MPKPTPEMVGKTYGKLTVTSMEIGTRGGKKQAFCICDCECGVTGVKKYALGLRRATIISCGCQRRKLNGMTSSSEFRIWVGVIQRCHNENNPDYPAYGGSGVIVCERWLQSFLHFLEDVGLRPSPRHSLDRHPDPYGNYEQSNVRWALPKQQANNRRNNVLITFNNETMTKTQWSERIGIDLKALNYRLKAWPLHIALTEPVNRHRRINNRKSRPQFSASSCPQVPV